FVLPDWRVFRSLSTHPLRWFVLWAVIGAVQQLGLTLNTAVAWLFELSKRVLAGADTYAEAGFETNPPMMIYLGLLPAWLHSVLGLSAQWSLQLFITILSAGTLLLSARVLRGVAALPDGAQNMFLIGLGYIVLVLPGSMMAQREHFILLFSLPYALVVFAFLEGAETPRWLRCIAGLFAGIALCIKPPFALVLLGLAGWVVCRKQLKPWFFRLENVAVVLAVAAFAAWVITQERFFIETVYPLLSQVYTQGRSDGWFDTNLARGVFMVMPMFGYFLAKQLSGGKATPENNLLLLCVLLMLAFYLVAAVQPLSFTYHAIPFFALTALLLFISSVRTRHLFLIAGLSFHLYYFINSWNLDSFKKDNPYTQNQAFKTLFDTLPKGSTYYSLTLNPFTPMPQPGTTQLENVNYLGGLWHRGMSLNPERYAAEFAYLDNVAAEDIIRTKPDYLVVDEAEYKHTAPETGVYKIFELYFSLPTLAPLKPCFERINEVKQGEQVYGLYKNTCPR
ncbi:MAG: hypothetical protein LW855_07260, partial [Alphaproteobacteria bacterium]|nr:hypothetical protein [Alphaproteobacteria bacterium]